MQRSQNNHWQHQDCVTTLGLYPHLRADTDRCQNVYVNLAVRPRTEPLIYFWQAHLGFVRKQIQWTVKEQQENLRPSTNVAMANLRPPDAASVIQSFSALTERPVPSLNSVNLSSSVFTADTYVTLRPWPLTMWPWPLALLPWTFVMYRLWRGRQALYQILTKSSNLRRSYCDFSIWPNNLEHVPDVVLHSVIIFTKFELGHPISFWRTTFYCW